MTSYVIEFNGSGEVLERHFANDDLAVAWADKVMRDLGHDDTVRGEWDCEQARERERRVAD